MSEQEVPRWARPAATGYMLLVVVLYGATFFAFVLKSRALALVAFAVIVVQFAVHITAGVLSYRQTMARPWPRVPPLVDDDD